MITLLLDFKLVPHCTENMDIYMLFVTTSINILLALSNYKPLSLQEHVWIFALTVLCYIIFF